MSVTEGDHTMAGSCRYDSAIAVLEEYRRSEYFVSILSAAEIVAPIVRDLQENRDRKTAEHLASEGSAATL